VAAVAVGLTAGRRLAHGVLVHETVAVVVHPVAGGWGHVRDARAPGARGAHLSAAAAHRGSALAAGAVGAITPLVDHAIAVFVGARGVTHLVAGHAIGPGVNGRRRPRVDGRRRVRDPRVSPAGVDRGSVRWDVGVGAGSAETGAIQRAATEPSTQEWERDQEP